MNASQKNQLVYSSPSEIKDSPDGKKSAFISPNEWEVSGDIYVMIKKTEK